MKSIKTKSRRIILSVSSLCLFFLALVWVSYFRQRSFDKEDAIALAIEKNSNLAVVLEQYAISTLRNADGLLRVIGMEYADGDSLDLRMLLEGNSLNRDFVENITIIGGDGRLKMTNLRHSNHPVADYSDHQNFKFHLHNNSDTLLISKPLGSKLNGRPVIVISRRLNDSKGDFAGVVALQIEPSVFTAFYAQAHLLPNDIISLISTDGITYARRTGSRESSGEDISKSPLFVHVANNVDSFYFAKDAIRQIPTWFSYRKLKEYPVIATVGSSEQEILEGYVYGQSRFILPRVLVSVLVLLFSVFISVFLLHRLKLSDRFIKEEERYQRLLTEQMVAVQEREREWIGRELHDNVNQVLTTVKLYLEMSAKKADDPLIPRSMQLINSSICEIRNLSHQLSAPTLGTGSLVDSINALIEMIGFSSNLQFKFDHERYIKGQLVMSQKVALYRILQEQLNNIVKHADATIVWISLYQKGDNVMLTVRDNGKGFDSKERANGMGINNIISRTKIFGGVVNIETSPNEGCCLDVAVPVADTEEKELA